MQGRAVAASFGLSALMARDFDGVFGVDMELGKQALAVTPTRMASTSIHISKVRAQLRAVDNDSYTPQYLPIGPFHLGCSSQLVEEEKISSAGFLHSLSEQTTKGGLTGLMEMLVLRARECYADGVGDMTPEQFSSMLLHDGCYLLLFFVDYVFSGRRGHVRRPTASVSRNTLVRDTVFLHENQIPFFVLQSIHERVTGGTSSVLDYIAIPVQELLQVQLFISKKPRPAPAACSHLLHLVHAYFQPTVLPTESAAGRRRPLAVTGRWRRATEYCRYANLRFKRRDFLDDVESSVLDVQLEGGTLWMPRLRVDSNTWTILRNLMALEEQARRRPVTAYCFFVSQLACTVEDVELLRRAGIVDHFLGTDKQVAQGFAELCKGLVFAVDNLDMNYLNPLWHELEERCDSCALRFMGWFWQGRNVWIAVAFLLAVIVFASQLMQSYSAGRGQISKL